MLFPNIGQNILFFLVSLSFSIFLLAKANVRFEKPLSAVSASILEHTNSTFKTFAAFYIFLCLQTQLAEFSKVSNSCKRSVNLSEFHKNNADISPKFACLLPNVLACLVLSGAEERKSCGS